jgi:cytochrome c oxidase cbb3-type subunit 3
MTRVRAIVVCASLLSAVGCDGLPGRPSEADRYLRPDQVVAFDALYAANCSGCHGAEGELGPARPLRDPLYLAIVPTAVLAETIRAGVPGTPMPAFAQSEGGSLTDAQIDALVAGLVKRWGASVPGGLPAYSEALASARGVAPGDPTRGDRAFGRFCAECHGADGRGSDKGGSVVDSAFLGLVSDQGLRTAVIVGRRDLDMPTWRSDVPGRPMTEQEISDVVAWLVARRPQYPGQPYPQQHEGGL